VDDKKPKYYLSKIIPKRRKTVKFLWCQKDWMDWAKLNFYRDKQRLSTYEKCQWCNYKFESGDSVSLAAPDRGKNMVICKWCADEMLSSAANVEKLEVEI
jgi:hypothetical protein